MHVVQEVSTAGFLSAIVQNLTSCTLDSLVRISLAWRDKHTDIILFKYPPSQPNTFSYAEWSYEHTEG